MDKMRKCKVGEITEPKYLKCNKKKRKEIIYVIYKILIENNNL
jgi:hypothetical protein